MSELSISNDDSELIHLNNNELMKKGNEFEEKKDYEQAYKYFKAAADNGDIKANTNIAYYFFKGMGSVTKNREKAYELFEDSAKKGHVRAQVNYAKLLEADKKYDEAIKWYKIAANAGEPVAKQWLKNQLKKVDLSISSDFHQMCIFNPILTEN